jgi:hypothetical protein
MPTLHFEIGSHPEQAQKCMIELANSVMIGFLVKLECRLNNYRECQCDSYNPLRPNTSILGILR